MRVREIMDGNRNGYIEREELRKFLMSCGVAVDSSEMGRIIDYFDKNKDKLISMQEFTDAMSR
jgi:Ca2+-binding EF-hand superfamily protein